jgi:hypothetical protein
METLLGVRYLTRNEDYMFSFDLQDGFYAMGINPGPRLLHCKRTRKAREAIYGVVPIPLLFIKAN